MAIRYACIGAILLGNAQRATAQRPDFSKHVAPTLQKYCVGCHNADDAKGKLRLDDFNAIMKGGKRGPALVPGKAAESLLVALVEGKAKPRMPPKDNPRPSAEEWALVKKWIDAGARSSTAAVAAQPRPAKPKIVPKRAPRLSVAAVAQSPKDNLLAVARYKSIELIDPQSGAIRGTLTGHSGPVVALQFSADGTLLVAAAGEPGKSGEARIWNVDARKLTRVFKGHRDSLYAAELSQNKALLATAGYDREIRLWDAASGKELRVLKGHNDAVYALSFRPDGKILASASGDRTVKLWDVATGQRLDTFPHSARELYAVAFSPSGDRVYAAGVDNRIRAWTVSASGKEGSNPILYSRFAHQSPILKLAFSADGKGLASSAEDKTVKLWDAATLAERHVLEPQTEWAQGLAFSRDGALLVVGRHDGSLATYDATNGRKRGVLVPQTLTPADEAFLGGLTQVAVDPTPGSKLIELPALPTAVAGTLVKAGDEHRFRFKARAGDAIVFDLQAAAMGSKLNATLALFDSSQRQLAASNDFDGQPDPLLVHRVAADGVYTIRVADAQFTGGPEHRYRMALGSFAFVAGVFPPFVRANQQSTVELAGFNLPPGASVATTAGAPGSETIIRLPRDRYRFRREFKVIAEAGAVAVEVEPNDAPAKATPLSVPGVAVGRAFRTSVRTTTAPDQHDDADLYRFHARAGSKWIVETEANRRGSPMDTRIEVLDASGKPVERLVLQAVRDSNIHFRGINSTNPDVRVRNWEEMELNELMYFRGEVCKIFRLPQGPDSGFLFYNVGGRRLAFFDTSSVAHAVNDPCYIVEPHPAGATPIPNGLPTFKLHYANDDSGDRQLGADSRLTFTAPADGDYLIRVTDVRGMGGDRYWYRLAVREPKPGFAVSLVGVSPDVSPGSGRSMTLAADRIDGFDGDIAVEIGNLPKGFFASNPTVIQSGHLEAQAVLWTAKDAPNPTPEDWAKVKIAAAASVEGSPVEKTVAYRRQAAMDRLSPPRGRTKQTKVASDLAKVKLGQPPKLTVKLEPAEIAIAPGSTVAATLSVERHGFDDRINFSVANLPHGVYVDNIGLNGILIPKGQSSRQIYLTARKWVPETTRPFFAIANVDNNQASPPVLLKVQRPKVLATK